MNITCCIAIEIIEHIAFCFRGNPEHIINIKRRGRRKGGGINLNNLTPVNLRHVS